MTLLTNSAYELDPNRPWPGLVPFPEKASAYFYGRNLECDDVLRRVRRDTATLLFGQSGLGKTSLLQAGLFPLLRSEGFLPVLVRLDYSTNGATPAMQVVATLRQALIEASPEIGSLLNETDGLWEYFHQTDLNLMSSRGVITPVLVFDQFEEAFTLGLARENMREKTQQFLTELAGLIENRPPDHLEAQFDNQPGLVERYVFDRQAYRIIISLREDYLAALESMRARAPSLGRNRFRLLPLNGRQALEAVVRPNTEIIGLSVAEEIVRFVSQARREDPYGSAGAAHAIETLEVEPSLLSLFCHELNERRLKIGAVEISHDLVVGSSQDVLQEFYEEALADQPFAVRTFIEDELITKSGFRESIELERAREILRQKGISPDVLDALVSRRLLRVEERLQVSRIEIIHDLLINVIRRGRTNRIQRREAATLAGTWVDKSPFCGLEPFGFEDTPIFFGRAEATRNAVDRLASNAESGRSFILILGADGVGKTTLIQAGMVPSLILSNAVFGPAAWHRVFVRPGAHPQGPVAALAEALAATDALPELMDGDPEFTLIETLCGANGNPAAPVVSALKARRASARQSGALPVYGVIRLVVVVDQLEELLILPGTTPAQREQFMACLQALVDAEDVYVIAAMRSAFWHRATELPYLLKLSDGLGRIDLVSPSSAELAEIIRKPAEAAGISFEVDPRTGLGLDSVILTDAAAELGVLPLLSFMLATLYAEDVARRGASSLTYGTYWRLGGLRGAIATRAEQTVGRLSLSAQFAVPRVIRALSSATPDGSGLIARQAPISTFPPGSDQRAVVEAMIEARLLVAANSGTSTTVRPAHDALLTHWEQARNVLFQDRRDLETRTVVEQQAKRWQLQTGRTKQLFLLRDPDLANAVNLANRWHDELDQSTLTFIKASQRRATRRQRQMAIAVFLFAVISVTAAGASFFATRQRNLANAERVAAARNYELALSSTINLLQQVQENLYNGRLSVAVASELLSESKNTLNGLDQSGSNPAISTSQIQLLLTLSDTLTQMGDYTKALSTLENARRLAEQLPRNDKTGATRERLLALVISRTGDVLQTQGNLTEALVQYRSATQLVQAAWHSDTLDLEQQRLLERLHNSTGDVLFFEGKFEEALVQYRTSIEIGRELAAKDTNVGQAQLDLGLTIARTGDLQTVQGNFGAALTSYQEAFALLRKLVGTDPGDTRLQSTQANMLQRIGSVVFELKRFDEALENYEEATTIRKKLATLDTANASWQRDLASSFDDVGKVLVAMRTFPRALQSLESALAIREKLAAAGSDNTAWQYELANSYEKVGDVLVELGNKASALDKYNSGLAVFQRLVTANPSNEMWRREMSALEAKKAALSR